ncbi:MAG: hypothetical protein IK093_18955 [Ruminiclostridium sp.]|nr:hypothetical protein [Ruminiclostridium sp.]
MRKFMKLPAMILAAAMLGGCGKVADFTGTLIHGLTAPTWKELRKQGLELCEETMAAVSDGDKEKLRELFCESNRNDDTGAAADSFFEGVGGSIKSYGEITQINEPIHFVRDSVDYAIMRFEVGDIDAGGGNLYTADVILCPYSYFEDKYRGLQYIAIYDGDELVCKAGKIIEYYEPQEIPAEYTPIDKTDVFSDPIINDFGSCVLYCLDNNDKDRFLSLFAESERAAAAEKYTEISALVGEGLESYSILFHDGLGKGLFKYDHYEELSSSIEINDILTKDGKLLEIDMYACLINLGEPSAEGISTFTIKQVQNEVNDKLGHDVISAITVGESRTRSEE